VDGHVPDDAGEIPVRHDDALGRARGATRVPDDCGHVVLTGHPDLAEVAVVGVASERWGESPVAVVVARDSRKPDGAEVIAWCRERLAHFKCPVAVHVVEALRRNASGKLLKHVLRTNLI
jgi:acyl-CoA synthetase (AMP-forming)/AMP-acid ligase II